jgi:NAD(P)-dependent dehydrogenase (short-subunit alcohol dehydrogenase family)
MQLVVWYSYCQMFIRISLVTQLQVNNAGVNFNRGADNSVEFAEQVIETNYFGTKRMIEAMIPLFKPSPFGGRIVNVSSRLGRADGRRNVSFTDRSASCLPNDPL